jgi:hypothetical protein
LRVPAAVAMTARSSAFRDPRMWTCSQPGSSDMTEQGAIEHIRSLARSGALKITVSERYWDFNRKEYRTRFKQANIPEGVAWRATKNENGNWVVVGDFGLEGTQVHAEYVIDSQTMSVGEVSSSG